MKHDGADTIVRYVSEGDEDDEVDDDDDDDEEEVEVEEEDGEPEGEENGVKRELSCLVMRPFPSRWRSLWRVAPQATLHRGEPRATTDKACISLAQPARPAKKQKTVPDSTEPVPVEDDGDEEEPEEDDENVDEQGGLEPEEDAFEEEEEVDAEEEDDKEEVAAVEEPAKAVKVGAAPVVTEGANDVKEVAANGDEED